MKIISTRTGIRMVRSGLLLAALAWMSMFASLATAQVPLYITVNVNSHPDPYLSNWATRKDIVIALITNPNKLPVLAKFDCQISKSNVLQAATNPAKMLVISIPPGVSQYYAEDIVPFDAVTLYGNVDRTAALTGLIPAGNYQICVALLDARSNKQITTPICRFFTMTSYQAPVLLQPRDRSMLEQINRPMFRWSAVSPHPPSIVTYHLVVMEVLDKQSKITAYKVNQPILDKQTNLTQLLWPPDVELPRAGMEYVWSVQAMDASGNPLGEPNGLGGPNTFFGFTPPVLKSKAATVSATADIHADSTDAHRVFKLSPPADLPVKP